MSLETDHSPGTVRESTLGDLRTLVLDPARGHSIAVLALRGATLLSWRVRRDDGDIVELIDGYADADEFRREDGMRSAVMTPFTNRISGSRYTFDGRDIAFGGGDTKSGPDVMHGLLRDQEFEVADITQGDATTTVELVSRVLRPGAFDGYPFAVDVSVTYTISSDAIEVVLTGTNVGDAAAPYSSGWHPYFRLGTARLEAFELCVAARARVVTADDLIPLEGGRAFQELAGIDDPFDFRTAKPIADSLLDVCYVDLDRSADGLIHTTVADPSQGLLLDVWQERGSVHVYTGDALEREPRASLAIEPVEALTNAVNRPDQSSKIRLEPGERRSFRFGVTARSS
jgi:aldose 1-epimerase